MSEYACVSCGTLTAALWIKLETRNHRNVHHLRGSVHPSTSQEERSRWVLKGGLAPTRMRLMPALCVQRGKQMEVFRGQNSLCHWAYVCDLNV